MNVENALYLIIKTLYNRMDIAKPGASEKNKNKANILGRGGNDD